MSYQLYRNTTLGHTLQEALDELMQLQLLSPTLALKVLLQFDKCINTALNTRFANIFRSCDAQNFFNVLCVPNEKCDLASGQSHFCIT